MNDNFILYKSTKQLFYDVLEYSNNIPRHLVYVRDELQVVMENILRYLHYYGVNLDKSYKIKEKYLKDLVVELSLVDFYLGFLYKQRVLGKVRFQAMIKQLESIRKLAYGVINSEKKLCEV